MTTKAELERRLVEVADNRSKVMDKSKELDVPYFIAQRAEQEANIRVLDAALALADAIRDEPDTAAEAERLRAENERLRAAIQQQIERYDGLFLRTANASHRATALSLRRLLNDTADQTTGGE